MPEIYPFGRPVGSCARAINSPRPLYVLGAYPSALHVGWLPPPGLSGKGIKAIPVDDEPEPFWNGADEVGRIEQWKNAVNLNPEWGTVEPVGHLNGSSGLWVDQQLLQRLDSTRANAWISDCLDRYHASVGLEQAIKERFLPFAERIGLAQPVLASHPGESEIVRGALGPQRDRLVSELAACGAEIVVTLGNAALRVMRELVSVLEDAPRKLQAERGRYGKRIPIEVEGRPAWWYPLAHPAAPKPFQDQHRMWRPVH